MVRMPSHLVRIVVFCPDALPALPAGDWTKYMQCISCKIIPVWQSVTLTSETWLMLVACCSRLRLFVQCSCSLLILDRQCFCNWSCYKVPTVQLPDIFDYCSIGCIRGICVMRSADRLLLLLPSPKWPILCRVGRYTLVYHTIPYYCSYYYRCYILNIVTVSVFKAIYGGILMLLSLICSYAFSARTVLCGRQERASGL